MREHLARAIDQPANQGVDVPIRSFCGWAAPIQRVCARAYMIDGTGESARAATSIVDFEQTGRPKQIREALGADGCTTVIRTGQQCANPRTVRDGGLRRSHLTVSRT